MQGCRSTEKLAAAGSSELHLKAHPPQETRSLTILHCPWWVKCQSGWILCAFKNEQTKILSFQKWHMSPIYTHYSAYKVPMFSFPPTCRSIPLTKQCSRQAWGQREVLFKPAGAGHRLSSVRHQQHCLLQFPSRSVSRVLCSNGLPLRNGGVQGSGMLRAPGRHTPHGSFLKNTLHPPPYLQHLPKECLRAIFHNGCCVRKIPQQRKLIVS